MAKMVFKNKTLTEEALSELMIAEETKAALELFAHTYPDSPFIKTLLKSVSEMVQAQRTLHQGLSDGIFWATTKLIKRGNNG